MKAGDVIIKEGDDGDDLYVVDKGLLKCTKIFVRVRLIIYLERSNRANLFERVQTGGGFWRTGLALQLPKSSYHYCRGG